jgi:23S rRNA (cytosine1962-C5)-methyltransferase
VSGSIVTPWFEAAVIQETGYLRSRKETHSTMIQLGSPQGWEGYELIDSGGQQKLERFGNQILIRPEPQALWEKDLTFGEWRKLANTEFRLEKGERERGNWHKGTHSRDEWVLEYPLGGGVMRFILRLTGFGHVGVFPEQAWNWNFIYDECKKRDQPDVLNMFAYTGGASLAARMGGANVWHVDAVKKVVSWSKENMETSGLTDIRWVVEDAMQYAKREVRREKQYDGIILDPPSYGRGPNGEKWVMDEMIGELMAVCSSLLKPGGFLVLNMYSMGYSSLIATNLVKSHFKRDAEPGELFLPDRYGKKLPLGVYARLGTL